ncbi:23S rRNA (guanosine(2251)-2'-O)-methyltransferase RlmB [Nisaea sp.]|uniref:23S rRNA (guanosine(2251)-2'-O)-methyltransferase RlmB n=1 Tax=Nisaea sp. TaxID=2024842 RepID=UPI003B52D9F2
MSKFRSRKPSQGRARGKPQQRPASSGKDLLWGWHAVSMALANEKRQIRGLLCTARSEAELEARLAALPDSRRANLPQPVVRDRDMLDSLAGEGAVHQGIIAEVRALPDVALEDVLEDAGEQCLLVLLDQVTDPHNVGAVLRSAAAFGARAVVATDRNAAPATGVLAKSASGALDAIDLVYVINLSRTMESLQESGFWCVGLDGDAEKTIAEVDLTGRVAIVMGAEGSGLRRLTREHCDLLVRLPTAGPVATLNVSAATAATLYEVARQNRG